MSGRADLVGGAAVALVLTNVWTSAQRPALAAIVTGDGPVEATHAAVVQVGVELLGAGVLTLVATTSPKAATSCLLIVTCLWLLWFVNGGAKRANGYWNLSNPFRVPGTVSPPVNTGPPIGTGPVPTSGGVPYSQQIPGLPPIPGMPYPTQTGGTNTTTGHNKIPGLP